MSQAHKFILYIKKVNFITKILKISSFNHNYECLYASYKLIQDVINDNYSLEQLIDK